MPVKEYFSIVGKTEDTKDDVFEIKSPDGWVSGCIHAIGCNIWAIHSNNNGGMKRMLNLLVEKTGKSHLTFTSVLNTSLAEKLIGFKPKWVYWDKVGEEMLTLEGNWEI